MPDIRQRFYFADSPVRGEIVQLEQSLAAIFTRHQYPVAVQRLLAELVTASVLLTATLKLQGRLSLQAQGKGALKMMMAECNHRHEVRAIAQVADDANFGDNVTLKELLTDGLLVITLEPEQGQRYQGIVALEGDSIADYLANYFAQSEQLPTRLWLTANGVKSSGLLLQALPHTTDEDADRWPRLLQLTETVKNEELLELAADEVLYRLYHEESVTLPASEAVCFACTCSREGTAQALISIGLAECEDILTEQGDIRLHCQFCHNEYVFDASDVKALFKVQVH